MGRRGGQTEADEEFEALVAEDTLEPLTRGAVRAVALRKHNVAPKATEWPVLSFRLPPNLLGLTPFR